jgi:hypothetical protein
MPIGGIAVVPELVYQLTPHSRTPLVHMLDLTTTHMEHVSFEI